MQRKFHVFLLLSLLLLTFIIGGCNDLQKAEKKVLNTDYPEHPINMIVPFSAGGGTDLQARTLEKMFPKYFKQNLIVLNKPGGGGTIGWNELVHAQPDGYTIGITATELLTHPIYGNTKYHYPTALEPIAQFASTAFIVVVNAEQPWNSLEDLIAYAKQNPNQLKFGHGGIGAIDHILGEQFAQATDIQIEQIPFQGGGEALGALLGSHIQINVANPAVVKEQLKAGRVKALATTGEHRFTDPALAKIPTLKELGYDMAFTVWYGIAAPKEIPPEVKEKLSDAFQKIAEDPEFKNNIENLGVQIDYLNSEECKERWAEESQKLLKLLQDTGIAEQVKAQKK